MRSLNLGFFRKVLLSVLVGMIHFVYHTDASGYTGYTYTANQSACTAYCGNSTYYKGLWATDIYYAIGAAVSSYVPGGWSASKCVCVTVAEYNSMISCIQKSCGAYVSGGVASGNAAFNLASSVCTAEKCTCTYGYYRYSTTFCSNCRPGYYCQGASSAACPAGRYTSVATQSTCIPCAKGYYNSVTGASRCVQCPGTVIGSTTLYGTTSNTGATNSVMNCYIADGSSFSDLTGSGQVTPVCYYS